MKGWGLEEEMLQPVLRLLNGGPQLKTPSQTKTVFYDRMKLVSL